MQWQGSPATGVCTLVVPNLRNYAFLLRIFEIVGAEGGLRAIDSLLSLYSAILKMLKFIESLLLRLSPLSSPALYRWALNGH